MRLRSLPPTACLFVLWLTCAGGCSNQGQGEVCDVNAANGGDSDCQSGLTCQPAPGARGSPNAYRCCPTDLATATAPVCMAGASIGASSAPPDAAVVTDAQTDAPAQASDASGDSAPSAEAGPDAAREAAPEATSDAAADGTSE